MVVPMVVQNRTLWEQIRGLEHPKTLTESAISPGQAAPLAPEISRLDRGTGLRIRSTPLSARPWWRQADLDGR